jgi:hypothetical protein
MAARQDQGLVFTLIAFVILFIIAFVAAYVGWKSYSESETHVAQLENDLNQERSAKTTFQTDNEQLLKWMGVGQFDNIADVEKSFKEDMGRYGATFGEDQQSYRKIVEYLAQENQEISSREASAKEKLKELKDRFQAIEAENEKKVAEYLAQANDAKQDAAAERDRHNKDRDALEATKRELQENLTQQEARYEEQLAAINTQLKELTDTLTKSERAKNNLLAEASKSAESFEVPDGRVSWVNQNGTVWINLGAADALRRQITFSVFDADALDPAKTEPKGSIEVTRILGDHMAEARITYDDPRNPVLTGDQIYSQVWHRGKRLRFALMGIVDMDGDGRNDMKLARDLIELNGGTVDAYVADDGKIEGNITVNTRYLVRGDHPEGANQAMLQEAWTTMSADAQTNGVEVITIDKFLNQIGYAPDDRVVQLGAGARASDFPPKPEAGSNAAGGASSPFRPRTPNRTPNRSSAPSNSYFRFSP